MCPHGLGNEDAECRFHRAFNNLTVDGLCPDCHVPLEKATLDDDRITMTVMGEEEIESEIEERTEETYRTHRLDEIAREVESIDANGDFPTSIARDKFKAQREADVEDRIICTLSFSRNTSTSVNWKGGGSIVIKCYIFKENYFRSNNWVLLAHSFVTTFFDC